MPLTLLEASCFNLGCGGQGASWAGAALAQPRSNFPPLCLPSLSSRPNLQSPTISLPLASAGCPSSLERSISATLLWALQYRRLFVLFCPPHQLRSFGRGSVQGSLPLTPCPSSSLSWWDSWDLSQEWGLLWWTSRNFQRHVSSARSQASWNPPNGPCSSSVGGQKHQDCDQAQVESAPLRLGTAGAGSRWYCPAPPLAARL